MLAVVVMMLLYIVGAQFKIHTYQDQDYLSPESTFVPDTVRIDTKEIATDSELIVEDREGSDILFLDSEVVESDPVEDSTLAKPISDSYAGTQSVQSSVSSSASTSSALQEKDNYYTVKSGDTLENILRKAGMDKSVIANLVTKLKPHFNPKRLKIGQEISVSYAEGDVISKVKINLSSAKYVMVSLLDNNIEVKNVELGLVPYVARKRIVIHDDTNFMTRAREIGVPESIISSLVSALSYQINFKKDIAPGSVFDILYEKVYTDEGALVGSSKVIYVNAQIKNKIMDVYRYDANLVTNFYYKNGNSIVRSLLKAPIANARISSMYGMRHHPVLKYKRMHKGVDFAAVSGTPIRAAGDGVIESIGYNRSYGNVVRIKHNDKFTTIYAHAKAFAKGMRRHHKVKQGEIIAYVGSTGLAKGAHLHYEVRENGKAVNPLKIKQPIENRLKGAELKQFSQHVDNIHKMLPNIEYDHEMPRNQLL